MDEESKNLFFDCINLDIVLDIVRNALLHLNSSNIIVKMLRLSANPIRLEPSR
jgi:hypothetical protein